MTIGNTNWVERGWAITDIELTKFIQLLVRLKYRASALVPIQEAKPIFEESLA